MKVKIFDKKFIPGLGLGPFDKEYINIEINLFKQLKALGFNISEEPERKINYVSEAQYSLNITPSFEEITKESPEEKTIVEETTTNDEAVLEITNENQETISYSEDDLKEMTNKQLKDLLEELGGEIPKKDTKPNLIEAILGE